MWYENSHMYSLYAVPYVTVWCSILLLSFVILIFFNGCIRKTWIAIVSWKTLNVLGKRADEDNQEQLKETETTTYSEGKYSLKDQNDKKVDNGNNIEIIDVKEDKVWFVVSLNIILDPVCYKNKMNLCKEVWGI